MNPGDAIGSNVFRSGGAEKSGSPSLVRPEKQIRVGRNRNQIAI
jgi:hypothetical protein